MDQPLLGDLAKAEDQAGHAPSRRSFRNPVADEPVWTFARRKLRVSDIATFALVLAPAGSS